MSIDSIPPLRIQKQATSKLKRIIPTNVHATALRIVLLLQVLPRRKASGWIIYCILFVMKLCLLNKKIIEHEYKIILGTQYIL